MAHDRFFALLREEHSKIQETLDKLEQGLEPWDRTWTRLKNYLIPHMKGEEKNFYAVLHSKLEARADAIEALKEHEEAEALVEEIDNMSQPERGQSSRFVEFKESVEHHIEDEENTVFGVARQFMDHKEIQTAMEAFEAENQRTLALMAVRLHT